MQSYREQKTETILVLDDKEAHYLKGLTQNALSDSESDEDKEIRMKFFESVDWKNKGRS